MILISANWNVRARCKAECLGNQQVDDKFFKLSEMETFLENMEKEEEQRDDQEEDDIDFFEDVDSDEDEGGLFGGQDLKVKFAERTECSFCLIT